MMMNSNVETESQIPSSYRGGMDANVTGGFMLPKLMPNNQNRLANNIQNNKYGNGGTVAHTRQSSIAKAIQGGGGGMDSHIMSPGDNNSTSAPGSRSKDFNSASKQHRLGV